MGIWIGRNRKVRIAYGFDDVAVAPGDSVWSGEVDTSFALAAPDGRTLKFELPVITSAMDSVSNAETCIQMSGMGALGVLNALGLQTRFEDPATAIGEIARAAPSDLIAILRRVYAEPVKEALVTRRIAQIKEAKAIAAVSLSPATAARTSASPVGIAWPPTPCPPWQRPAPTI